MGPQLQSSRLLPANSLNHTRKSSRREGLFSFSWTLPSGGRSSASGSDLGRSSRGRAPTKYDSFYPTFRLRAQARNGLGHELRRGYCRLYPGSQLCPFSGRRELARFSERSFNVTSRYCMVNQVGTGLSPASCRTCAAYNRTGPPFTGRPRNLAVILSFTAVG